MLNKDLREKYNTIKDISNQSPTPKRICLKNQQIKL
jgi:hypothetical protein